MSGRWRRRCSQALLLTVLSAVLAGCFSSPPQIVALDPNRGSVGVPADSPITVQFDRPVVPATVATRFSVSPAIHGCDLHVAFHAGPGAACSIRWLADDTGFVLEHPGAVLAASTPYHFLLAGGIAGPDGSVNGIDHRWDITTGSAPVVRSFTPADGATNVPADLSMAVSFSAAMDDGSTRDAISLTPAIPGTRILRNPADSSRFLVLPGRPLVPGTRYRLSVGTGATDEHGLALAATVSATFTAGPLSATTHALVLAGPRGGAATEVDVAALTVGEPGDPLAAETMLAAPQCPGPARCGAAGPGAALYTFSGAALSPDGRWLAVVERDATAAGAPSTLLVLDTSSYAVVASIAGGSLPAWSPDSQSLAFALGARVAVYSLTQQATTLLPAGGPLAAAPVWAAGDELLALVTGAGGGPRQVELADTVVLARYGVPSLDDATGDVCISPGGTELAAANLASGVPSTWIAPIGAGAGAPPRRLTPGAVPVGWADEDTLLTLTQPATGPPALVAATVSGGTTPITPAPPPGSLAGISVASSGRELAFIAPGLLGIAQAEVESTAGGVQTPLTAFSSSLLEALSVTLT